MRKKMGILFFVFLVVMLEVCMTGCSQSEDAAKAAEDEIKLIIQLDLKEDIGLLILDNNLNGVETSGGISNADKTTLKHDEALDWTLSKNSKVTMDIYAKVKYNKPEELSAVVNEALDSKIEKAENAVSGDS